MDYSLQLCDPILAPLEALNHSSYTHPISRDVSGSTMLDANWKESPCHSNRSILGHHALCFMEHSSCPTFSPIAAQKSSRLDSDFFCLATSRTSASPAFASFVAPYLRGAPKLEKGRQRARCYAHEGISSDLGFLGASTCLAVESCVQRCSGFRRGDVAR